MAPGNETQAHVKSIDCAEVVSRIIGLPDYKSTGRPIPVGQDVVLHIVEFAGDRALVDASDLVPESVHLIVDGAGGYRAFIPGETEAMREGHLSEFETPGFTTRIWIDFSIHDARLFNSHFGQVPDTPQWDGVKSGFFNLEDGIAAHLELRNITLRQIEAQAPGAVAALRVELEGVCRDELKLVQALREDYKACWGSMAGFPKSRPDVLAEAALLSNANPSPDLCGFEIENFGPVSTTCDPELDLPLQNSLSF